MPLCLFASLIPTVASAYTAAGDRNFPATLILPQIAPSDAFWGTLNSQPTINGYTTQFTGTYSKTITERLGIQLEDGFTHRASMTGGQNFDLQLQYEAVLDQQHEFILSFQVDHEFGGTGSQSVGSFQQGSTQPAITFGKGLGDLPIGYWRPLAITGFAGYEIATGSRPNMVNTGFSIQYSIPYLVSRVANLGLPSFLRGMTPITEIYLTTPAGRSNGRSTTLVVAPGLSYSQGSGWEFGVEAMIPTTRQTGTGLGFIAQLVIQLDYLFPESNIGRPIFRPPLQ